MKTREDHGTSKNLIKEKTFKLWGTYCINILLMWINEIRFFLPSQAKLQTCLAMFKVFFILLLR